MSKKLIFLISFVLVLGLVSGASAQDPDYLDLWAEFLFDSPDPCEDTSIHDHNITFLGADATVGVETGYNGTAYQGTKSAGLVSYAQFPPDAWPADGNVTFEMMLNFDTFETIEADARSSGPGWQYTTMMPLSMTGHYFQFESAVNDVNGFSMNSNFWWEYNPDESWEGYVAGPLPWETDRWYHWVVSMDNTNKVIRHWIDGVLVAETQHTPDANFNNPGIFTADFYLGSQTDEPAFPFQGRIDEVRFYSGWIDSPLLPGGPGAPRGRASRPDPKHGEENVSRPVTISWKGGSWVADTNGHEVYFGSSFAEVNDANISDATGVYRGPNDVNSLPDPQDANFVRYTYNVPETLDLGKTYYWRIDEVNESYVPGPNEPNAPPDGRWKGNIWHFEVEGKALNPFPADGADEVPKNVILSWTPGAEAATHDVYIGTSFTAVDDANTNTAGISKGNQSAPNYPASLEPEKTYYWRIDEVNTVTVKGNVWSLEVAPYTVVDNFDSYASQAELWNVWDDYWTNSTGSEVFVEEDVNITRDGNSLMYKYDCGTDYKKVGSRIDATMADLRVSSDWSAVGIKALVLYFYGQAGNSATANDRMWVELEDTSSNAGVALYDGDPNDVQLEQWNEWNIDMAIFDACGVSLPNIDKIHIGFGGPPIGQSKAGGSGTLYFDDIRLWAPRCVPAYVSGDVTGDCIIDGYDIDAMGADWLVSDFAVTPEAPNSANLLVEYLFDGGSDDYNDSSGVPYYHGNASTFATTSGGYLTLDGVSYVDIPFGAANPFQGATDFSIAMSFKTTQPGMLISSSKADPCDVTEAEYDRAMSVYPVQGPWLAEGVDSGEVVVYENNFWNWTWSDPVAAVLDDQWHHMVVTYDADGTWTGFDTTGLFKVYLDGVPPSQDMSGDPNIPNIHLDTVRIGDTFNPDIETEGITEFVGDIDDVRIYDYPLTLANALWLAGEVNDVYFELDSAANLVLKTPDDQTYDANNPDIVNFIDYGLLAEHWLEGPTLWP